MSITINNVARLASLRNLRIVTLSAALNTNHYHAINKDSKSNHRAYITSPSITATRYNASIKLNLVSRAHINSSARDRIEKMVTNGDKRVFVFMKGVPKQPACGYSNAVIQILDAYGFEYDSFNVLKDDEIRQEVKAYSNWPTIPQVYVDGKFIGGCDILIQMHESNEMENLLKEPSEKK